MKKGLFTALFTLGFAAFVSAQTPTAVSTAFSNAKPGVNPTFVQQNDNWIANFTEGGKQLSYIYTPEAIYIGKETVIAKSDIPTPALQDMEARFGGFEFEGVAKRELADGSIHYKYQYLSGNRHVEVFYAANGHMVSRNVF